MASIDERDPLGSLEFNQRQRLKDVEDELIDADLILDSTDDTMNSLLENYRQYCHAMDSSSNSDFEADIIHRALREKRKQIMFYKKQIRALHHKVQGTINLVSEPEFAP